MNRETDLCFFYEKYQDGGKQTLFGDSIHHDHQKYYYYNCGAILDRDENAVNNIKNYAIKQQRAGLQPS